MNLARAVKSLPGFITLGLAVLARAARQLERSPSWKSFKRVDADAKPSVNAVSCV